MDHFQNEAVKIQCVSSVFIFLYYRESEETTYQTIDFVCSKGETWDFHLRDHLLFQSLFTFYKYSALKHHPTLVSPSLSPLPS